MDYGVVKLIHQSAVAAVLGFLARGLGMLADSDWVRDRAARTLPHIVDTILLLSGVTLMAARLSPAAAPWLAANLGLVVYIGLGTIALRRSRTNGSVQSRGSPRWSPLAISFRLSPESAGFLTAPRRGLTQIKVSRRATMRIDSISNAMAGER
jgi:uncharacterized membrane protein SirB2